MDNQSQVSVTASFIVESERQLKYSKQSMEQINYETSAN